MGRLSSISVSPFSATIVVLLVIVWSSQGHGQRQDPKNPDQFHHGLDPTAAIAGNPERFREQAEVGAPPFLAELDLKKPTMDAFQGRSKKEKRRTPFRSDLGKRLFGPTYALQLPVVLEEEDSEWREVKDDDEKRGKRYRTFKADLGKRSRGPSDRGFADDFGIADKFDRNGYEREEEEERLEDPEDTLDLSKRRMFRSDLG